MKNYDLRRFQSVDWAYLYFCVALSHFHVHLKILCVYVLVTCCCLSFLRLSTKKAGRRVRDRALKWNLILYLYLLPKLQGILPVMYVIF